jgi:curli biogenesis system outer membrane secretion channel CsgG
MPAMFSRTAFLLAVAFALDGASAAAAQTVHRGASLQNVGVIAIVGFQGQRGGQLAAALTQSLVADGRFRVVDRDRTAQLMWEARIGSSGLLNPEERIRLGEFTGAQAYLLGQVVDVQQTNYTSLLDSRETRVTVQVQLTLIDLRTAEVLASRQVVRSVSSETRQRVIEGIVLGPRNRSSQRPPDPVRLRAAAFEQAADEFVASL